MEMHEANQMAYDVVAKISNPNSFSYMTEFPGLDKLGFDEKRQHTTKAKNVGFVVHQAISAGEYWVSHGENSAPFGAIQTLLQFDIVQWEDIDNALFHYRTNK